MTLPRLARSTPFRLTVRLVAIFAAAMLACFIAAFLVIRGYLDADLRNALAQDLTAWKATEGPTDLAERIKQAIAASSVRNRLIVLVEPDGTRIGNAPGLQPGRPFRIVGDSQLGLPNAELADSYLVATKKLPGGTLILGRDRERVSELVDIFSMVFLIGVVPTLVLAAGLGLITAQGARSRVEAIRGTLERLTGGELDARVAGLEGETDDLAEIGGAVNRMAAAQEASTSSLRQVSADIAHDLKTPIQRVSVLLDVASNAGPLTEAQRAALDRARSETGQIVQTFQSLLQIAQIEGGDAWANFSAVDLSAVVGGIAEIYGPVAEESGHRLDWFPPAAPVRVRGDRNLLGQIAANLIENGLRHTPPGTAIEVALNAAGVLSVADNGPGIPVDERDNVLRRLYRLERSRTTEGSGLGLSLVSAIAELHGATLTLGDAGPGLIVRLVFPLAAPALPAA